MNINDHRPLAAKLRWRTIEKSADRAPIPRFPVDELRLREVRGIQPAGFAESPALDFPGLHIKRINIRTRSRRRQAESHVAIILLPVHARENTLRQARDDLFLTARGIEQMQHAETVFVGNKSDGIAIPRKIELLHIPRNAAAEVTYAAWYSNRHK